MARPTQFDEVFRGAAGSTRSIPTTVWCGGCGIFFGASFLLSLDADDSPELLQALLSSGYAGVNAMDCPRCGWRHVAEEPLVVHLPGQALLLVVPAAQRHRVQHLRADLLRAVADEPGDEVPPYAFEPKLLVGLDGLVGFLKESARDAHESSALTSPKVQLPRESAVEPALRLEEDEEAEPTTQERAVPRPPIFEEHAPALPFEEEDEEVEPTTQERAIPRPKVLPETMREPAGESLDVDLRGVDFSDAIPVEEKPTELLRASRPPEPRPGPLVALEKRPEVPAEPEPLVERWDKDLDADWDLDKAVASRVKDDSPTHVVRLSDVLVQESGFDPERAEDSYALLKDGEIRLYAKLDSAHLAAVMAEPLELRFQLHLTEDGPAMLLLLVRSEEREAAAWWLEPDEHGALLDALERRFEAVVYLCGPDHQLGEKRTLTRPLSQNVTSARAELRRQALKVEPAAIRRRVMAPDFDRVGRLRHNFREDSFLALPSAAKTRLALGIVSYWSTPERRDYLLWIKAFPEVWFDAMVRRVLESAVSFGLAIEPHLRPLVLDLELAENSASLARRLLANFAEVSLNLKPSELEPIDLWENWEALLAYAEELDVRVDEEIEELAALAMERARELSCAGESVELDAAVSVELEELSELSELDEGDLIALLEQPSSRAEAARALLLRGNGACVASVFDAIKRLSREELLATVPLALAQGPAFEGHFMVALRSRRISLWMAAALFLAEIRSETALPALLSRLLSADEPQWPVLARGIARMGRRIIGPAQTLLAERGDVRGRLAHTLALLGAEARGALAAARDQSGSELVKAALTAALEQIGEVSFGDPADFAERLEEAFRVAGPDALGPDFEEHLESD